MPKKTICETILLCFQTQNLPILTVGFLRSNLNRQLELFSGQFSMKQSSAGLNVFESRSTSKVEKCN